MCDHAGSIAGTRTNGIRILRTKTGPTKIGRTTTAEVRIAAVLVVTLLSAAAQTAKTPAAPYLDPSQPINVRVDDLISRMTLEEKVSQLANQSRAIPRLQVPEYDWWNEALHGVARAGTATVFPEPIGLAATFDPPPVSYTHLTLPTIYSV